MSIELPARSFDQADVAPANPPATVRHYTLLLAAVIAVGMLLLLAIGMPDIAARRYMDTDDLVRLQQVRDWMAGQSWFDVTQYRISPPAGMPMHWSRLVDVPIAAIIWIIRPFAGQVQAEVAASVAVPLVTYAFIAALVAAITRQLMRSDRVALLAATLCPFDCGAIAMVRPMRIDHHGWQAVCALAMVLALTSRRGWRPVAVAGAFAALWMHISLEGALFTVACGAWLGLLWILEPRCEQWRLPSFLGAITIGSFVLFLVAHGGALFDRNFADAISPIHLIIFAFVTFGTAACLPLAKRSATWRCAGLGVIALVAAVIYKLFGPQHAGDPFAMLGPLSYQLWYLRVSEGLPLWSLPAQMAGAVIGYPLVVLVSVGFKLHHAEGDTRRTWLGYGALLVAATLLGVVIQRTGYAANLIALPGGALLMGNFWTWAMARRHAILRVVTAFTAVATAGPAFPSIAALTLVPSESVNLPTATPHVTNPGEACGSFNNLAHLDVLPPSIILTPISTSEALVAATHHSTVAAGYHRDHGPLEDLIRFFVGSSVASHAIARQYHVRFLLVCVGDDGVDLYARSAPSGLAAQMRDGQVPAWLRPVSVAGLHNAVLYRVAD